MRLTPEGECLAAWLYRDALRRGKTVAVAGLDPEPDIARAPASVLPTGGGGGGGGAAAAPVGPGNHDEAGSEDQEEEEDEAPPVARAVQVSRGRSAAGGAARSSGGGGHHHGDPTSPVFNDASAAAVAAVRAFLAAGGGAAGSSDAAALLARAATAPAARAAAARAPAAPGGAQQGQQGITLDLTLDDDDEQEEDHEPYFAVPLAARPRGSLNRTAAAVGARPVGTPAGGAQAGGVSSQQQTGSQHMSSQQTGSQRQREQLVGGFAYAGDDPFAEPPPWQGDGWAQRQDDDDDDYYYGAVDVDGILVGGAAPPPRAAAAGARSRGAGGDVTAGVPRYEGEVAALVAMGFTPRAAAKALRVAQGDVEAAVEIIVAQGLQSGDDDDGNGRGGDDDDNDRQEQNLRTRRLVAAPAAAAPAPAMPAPRGEQPTVPSGRGSSAGHMQPPAPAPAAAQRSGSGAAGTSAAAAARAGSSSLAAAATAIAVASARAGSGAAAAARPAAAPLRANSGALAGPSTAAAAAPRLAADPQQQTRSRVGNDEQAGVWRLPLLGSSPCFDGCPLALPPLAPGRRFEQDYKVVLVLDQREQFQRQQGGRAAGLSAFASQIAARGIDVVARTMEAGDALWVAQRRDNLGLEYVLDFIVERKSVGDLESSIKDGRYSQQKYRLSRSGLSRVMYLVEGDIDTMAAPPASIKACKTATAETEVVNGFTVLRTSGSNATVRLYGDLTLAISALYAQRTAASPQQQQQAAPTYADFQERLARSKRVTVRDVWGLMLSGVPKVGKVVSEAIVAAFPTPKSLYLAYKECIAGALRRGGDGVDAAQGMLAALPLQGAGRTVGRVTSKVVYDTLFASGWNV